MAFGLWIRIKKVPFSRPFHWHSPSANCVDSCLSELSSDPDRDFRFGNDKNALRSQAKAIYVSAF